MSGELSRFTKLPAHVREGFLARVAAGMIDPPADLAAMQEWHEDQRPKGPARPGWQLQEELAAQARKRAGLVDSPGALERHRATEAAKRAEAAYREDLGGYQPRYAWERH